MHSLAHRSTRHPDVAADAASRGIQGTASRLTLAALASTALATAWAASATLFEQDFSRVAVGGVPEDFLVLDGQFGVKEDAGNKLFELPGAPLDTYGFLFGPNHDHGVQVVARIQSSRQGRKFPTFAVGLNGGGGYKLRIAPAKNAVELLRGDEVKATATFPWKSGEWTHLKLQVRKTGDARRIEGRAWQGTDEPTSWTVSWDDPEPMPAGKSGAWGMPFAGTPIRFDDLRIVAAE